MKSKLSFIEENLFGCVDPLDEKGNPYGTAQENFDGFISEWGKAGLKMDNGYEITVEDIQEYFEELKARAYPLNLREQF